MRWFLGVVLAAVAACIGLASPGQANEPQALEDPAHAAVAEQVEVVDAVGTGEHPADHTRRFRDRVRRVHAQALLDEVMQTSGFGQPQRGDQTGRHTRLGSSKTGRMV